MNSSFLRAEIFGTLIHFRYASLDEQEDDLIISSRDEEKIDDEIQQGSEEQGALVANISATTNPDLQGAFLKNYENLPKQDNSSTEKDTGPIFENKGDLKGQHLSYLLKWYNFFKRHPEIEESSASTISSTEQLAAIDLKKRTMRGDGNCFFHAIEDQLRLHNHNHKKTYRDIRSDAVEYLRTEKFRFEDFIDKNQYRTYENYIKQMSENNETYADYLALSATAIIVKKNIIVHERGQIPLKIPGYVPHGDQLHVWYDPISQHYDSVVSSDDRKPQVLSLEQMIET
jgi:hypothetical protein